MERGGGEASTVSDLKYKDSLTGGAKSIVDQSLNQVSDLLRLFSLEAKLAVQSAIWMMVAAVLLAVIVVGLWVAVQAIAIFYLQHLGFSPLHSTILMFFINMLAACCLYLAILRKLKHLGFNVTLRNLTTHSQDNVRANKDGR
jgi:hypothetical protein